MRKVRLIDRRIAKIKGGGFVENESSTNVGSRHHDMLLSVLRTFKNKSFTPDDVVDAYFKAGGTSDSEKPKGTLMQVLRKMPGIHRESRGVYTYKSKG